MGYTGMDFVILDLEHGPNSVQTLQNLIRAAEVSGILPIVRVKEDARHIIGEVLDIGAAGIQVPQISDAGQIDDVICAAKFAPLGERGVCRFVRAADYSVKDRHEYFKKANEALVIVQLEGGEALQNLESIMETEGIDIFFVGPYDLSQSLGVQGQIKHPRVVDAIEEIVEQGKKKDVAVGTFVDTIEDGLFWQEKGVSYIAYSVDVGIFADGCKGIVGSLAANHKS
jgi:4-hydroxy-2-oxoheptanedioate aldolase